MSSLWQLPCFWQCLRVSSATSIPHLHLFLWTLRSSLHPPLSAHSAHSACCLLFAASLTLTLQSWRPWQEQETSRVGKPEPNSHSATAAASHPNLFFAFPKMTHLIIFWSDSQTSKWLNGPDRHKKDSCNYYWEVYMWLSSSQTSGNSPLRLLTSRKPANLDLWPFDGFFVGEHVCHRDCK